MVPSQSRRLIRLVSRLQNSFPKCLKSPAIKTAASSIALSNPVVNYYRYRAQTNLQNLYRFALQTRSVAIRDIFAQVASNPSRPLNDLLQILHYLLLQDVTLESHAEVVDSFDSSVLIALADLLANTAQNDLDTHAAVLIYNFVEKYFGENVLSVESVLQKAEALNELGEHEQSQALAEAYAINETAPLQSELLRLQALRMDSGTPVDEWFAALNKLFASLGMSTLQLVENDSLPIMDRLSASSVAGVEGPKVTVIVPTFSPGYGIRTALRGLLEQTWQNLEIIVVDDASPEQYREIFSDLKQLDPRVRVIHQKYNGGAYVARNVGLRAASGTFITVHDDDDWSHPDKIALQVQPLLDDEALVATTSAHIRTTENLEFERLNAQAKFLQMNYSSLMFRRSLVNDIGDWDAVNRGGDSEFYSRVLEFAGPDSVVGLHDRPLSFSRVWEGSLTSGEMYRGFFGYSRLIYRWAFRQWHREVRERGESIFRSSHEPRPYPVPTTFEGGRRNTDLGTFDIIYISDFFRQAKAVNQVLHEMSALADYGFRVGYLHLYSPETRSTTGFHERLFDLQLGGKIEQVSVDDVAQTDLLLVYDVAIGMFLDQIKTKIRSRRSVAVEVSSISLADVEPRMPSFIPQALAHLDASFEAHFETVGATVQDHLRLRRIVPSGRVLSDEMVWYAHVPEGPGEVVTPKMEPVVGFHSDTNLYRWPMTLKQFKSVYVSDEFITRFYGPIEKPLGRFGTEILQEVELVDRTYCTERDFLRNVDFWVYWPHGRLEDQVWEPVLSALRAGKVVILPQALEPLYNDAAVYAAKDQVSSIVRFYSRNPGAYIDQAKRGQAHVEANFSKDSLLRRVANLKN